MQFLQVNLPINKSGILFVSLKKRWCDMIIERTNNEVIIRLPGTMDTSDLEEMVDYIRFKEITSKSKASQEQIDSLVKEVKKGRWEANKKRLLGE
jgi:uncharacterized membrane-anchored protein